MDIIVFARSLGFLSAVFRKTALFPSCFKSLVKGTVLVLASTATPAGSSLLSRYRNMIWYDIVSLQSLVGCKCGVYRMCSVKTSFIPQKIRTKSVPTDE